MSGTLNYYCQVRPQRGNFNILNFSLSRFDLLSWRYKTDNPTFLLKMVIVDSIGWVVSPRGLIPVMGCHGSHGVTTRGCLAADSEGWGDQRLLQLNLTTKSRAGGRLFLTAFECPNYSPLVGLVVEQALIRAERQWGENNGPVWRQCFVTGLCIQLLAEIILASHWRVAYLLDLWS